MGGKVSVFEINFILLEFEIYSHFVYCLAFRSSLSTAPSSTPASQSTTLPRTSTSTSNPSNPTLPTIQSRTATKGSNPNVSLTTLQPNGRN